MKARGIILPLTALFGAVLVGMAFAALGARTGVGAIAGASLAFVNVAVIRWVVGRVTTGDFQQRNGVFGLLGVKLMILATAIFGLIALGVDGIGIAIGYGALVFAVVLGSSLSKLSTPPAPET